MTIKLRDGSEVSDPRLGRMRILTTAAAIIGWASFVMALVWLAEPLLRVLAVATAMR